MIGEIGGEDINHNVVRSTCRLDVYGAVRQSSGASESSHKFVGALGHTSESSTDLIYMRARYYDPVVGRFISQDSARDGVNWYVYCDNDPVNLVDSDGRVAGPTAAAYAALSAMFGAVAGFVGGYLSTVAVLQIMDPNWKVNALALLNNTLGTAAVSGALAWAAKIGASKHPVSQAMVRFQCSLYFTVAYVVSSVYGATTAWIEYLTSPEAGKQEEVECC